MEVKDAREFADVLASLWPNNVLLYGLADRPRAKLTVTKRYTSARPEIIPRAKSHIKHRPRPGILCLDYDPQKGKEPLTHRELLQALYSVVPDLEHAPLILAHSASTYIYNENRQLKGHKGKRVYVLVQDASDIHRAGKALFERLYAAGHGWTVTTKSGAVLRKTLVDSNLFSAVQIDYAAGAVCAAPLVQRRPEPVVLRNDAGPLDTRAAILDLPGERAARKARKAKAQDKIQDRDQERPAGEFQPGQLLEPDIRIELKSGIRVSWREILRNPAKYHKQLCLDPFENSKDGMIFSKGTPGIRSFLSGGTFYKSRYQNFAEMPKLAGVIRKAVARS